MLRKAYGYRFCDAAGTDGGNDGAGGADNNNAGSGGTDGGDKTVQYGTYKRTVDQLKKAQDIATETAKELESYKEKERLAEEKRLSEQGEYQKLLEIEKEKNKLADAKLSEHEKAMMSAHKLNAFREKLPGKLKNNAYYDFVDIDNIIIDPSTGVIDDGSLDKVVNGFMQEHSALIDSKVNPNMPDNAPQNTGSGILTYDEWRKLPTLAERKKRFQEMKRNDLNKT